MLVDAFSDLLRKSEVVANQVGRVEVQCRQRGGIREVKHLVKIGGEPPQLSRKEILNAQALVMCLECQLCHDTRSGEAEIQDWKAVWRVVPSTDSPSPVPAARIETPGLIPEGDGAQPGGDDSSECSRVERGHVRQ